MSTADPKQLTGSLPLFIGGTLLASFLLLMVVFRSVTVPLKAALVNLLSIGGACGVVVAVFQRGWLGGLFGLSMDYEVFLVSRIREAYVATGDTAESVARGLAATGRVITSGALIMAVVFRGFVTDPSPFVKMTGLGLAAALAPHVRQLSPDLSMSWLLPSKVTHAVSVRAGIDLDLGRAVPRLGGGRLGCFRRRGSGRDGEDRGVA